MAKEAKIDLREQLRKLITLIHGYVSEKVSAHELNAFAWENIDCFSSTAPQSAPRECEFEPEFWYAIWQIQHLAGERDEVLTRKEMERTLAFLEGREPLPDYFRGHRPAQNRLKKSDRKP